MAALYFVLKNLSRGAVRSVPFFVTGPILALLLCANMTVLVGAIRLKGETDSMQLWLMQKLDGMHGVANLQSSQQVGDMVNEEFPLLGCFFNLFDMSGHPISDLPEVFSEMVNSELNGIIWGRLLWSLGIIVAATLIALFFDKGEGYGGKKTPKAQTASIKNFDDF